MMRYCEVEDFPHYQGYTFTGEIIEWEEHDTQQTMFEAFREKGYDVRSSGNAIEVNFPNGIGRFDRGCPYIFIGKWKDKNWCKSAYRFSDMCSRYPLGINVPSMLEANMEIREVE